MFDRGDEGVKRHRRHPQESPSESAQRAEKRCAGIPQTRDMHTVFVEPRIEDLLVLGHVERMAGLYETAVICPDPSDLVHPEVNGALFEIEPVEPFFYYDRRVFRSFVRIVLVYFEKRISHLFVLASCSDSKGRGTLRFRQQIPLKKPAIHAQALTN